MWYYSQVRDKLNMTMEQIQSFYRLVYINGMYHCSGGPGAWNVGQVDPASPTLNSSDHNLLLALVKWTETGDAPNSVVGSLVASNGTVLNQRSQSYLPTLQVPSPLNLSPRNSLTLADFRQDTASIRKSASGTGKVTRILHRAGGVKKHVRLGWHVDLKLLEIFSKIPQG